MNTIQEKTQEFLTIAPQFKLGKLVTESQHPKTLELSHLAQHDLPQAVQILKDIDLDMLSVLSQKLDAIYEMAQAVKACFEQGGRVFLDGCGSTGRLSLTLETLWRELHPEAELHNRVISFMAGGDIALIKSIEDFEDFPSYGARQLTELGFCEDDLLISTTEGGETPFVIGATEQAVRVSRYAPYFLYCNPDEILCEVATRSKRVIENEQIRKINLTVGPMAISGSTRMQASTVLMLAVGLALIHYNSPQENIAEECERLQHFYKNLDASFLPAFIEEESRLYQQNGMLFYEAEPDFAISILTDTTERAPTFSLHPFENLQDKNLSDFSPSLCYLVMPGSESPQQAWEKLLGRKPRALDWKEYAGRVDQRRLFGHDFSRQILQERWNYLADKTHAICVIKKRHDNLNFRLNEVAHSVPLGGLSRLDEHSVLKMLLNTHSTLVMGRIGRYEGNLMTYVRPSNNKLIDRTIRYVGHLLAQRGIEHSYEDIAYACFQEMETIHPDEPIVLRVLEHFVTS